LMVPGLESGISRRSRSSPNKAAIVLLNFGIKA
jgi:hypothetical protein